jgi:hypothetical protein
MGPFLSIGRGHDGFGASGEPQAFFHAFPNLSLISPSFSKDSFGGCMEFQGLAIESKPKRSSSKFLALHGPEEPFAYGQTSLIVEGTRKYGSMISFSRKKSPQPPISEEHCARGVSVSGPADNRTPAVLCI